MAENLAPACDGTRAINNRPTGDTRARRATREEPPDADDAPMPERRRLRADAATMPPPRREQAMANEPLSCHRNRNQLRQKKTVFSGTINTSYFFLTTLCGYDIGLLTWK